MENKNKTIDTQTVAAVRDALQELKNKYFDIKVDALKFLADIMEDGKTYTAAELACMSGLTSGEVAAQVGSNYCVAAYNAKFPHNRVQKRTHFEEMRFVQILPDGTINPERTRKFIHRVRTYKLVPRN